MRACPLALHSCETLNFTITVLFSLSLCEFVCNVSVYLSPLHGARTIVCFSHHL